MEHHTTFRWRQRAHWLALLPTCLQAVSQLALARIRHLSIAPRDIVALNAAAIRYPPSRTAAQTHARIQTIAFVIPRIAARLPWRADCLVQALAAQRWLRRHGIPSQISIGVDRSAEGEFAAHAWLKHGDQIVTGGEISRYSPLLVPESDD